MNVHKHINAVGNVDWCVVLLELDCIYAKLRTFTLNPYSHNVALYNKCMSKGQSTRTLHVCVRAHVCTCEERG